MGPLSSASSGQRSQNEIQLPTMIPSPGPPKDPCQHPVPPRAVLLRSPTLTGHRLHSFSHPQYTPEGFARSQLRVVLRTKRNQFRSQFCIVPVHNYGPHGISEPLPMGWAGERGRPALTRHVKGACTGPAGRQGPSSALGAARLKQSPSPHQPQLPHPESEPRWQGRHACGALSRPAR